MSRMDIQKTVDSVMVNYLTSDGLWDLKVSKSKPTSKHTLQLLMYWIMGKHSGQKIYDNIQKFGIFNPRLNTVYTMDVRLIPQETIEEVEKMLFVTNEIFEKDGLGAIIKNRKILRCPVDRARIAFYNTDGKKRQGG